MIYPYIYIYIYICDNITFCLGGIAILWAVLLLSSVRRSTCFRMCLILLELSWIDLSKFVNPCGVPVLSQTGDVPTERQSSQGEQQKSDSWIYLDIVDWYWLIAIPITLCIYHPQVFHINEKKRDSHKVGLNPHRDLFNPSGIARSISISWRAARTQCWSCKKIWVGFTTDGCAEPSSAEQLPSGELGASGKLIYSHMFPIFNVKPWSNKLNGCWFGGVTSSLANYYCLGEPA